MNFDYMAEQELQDLIDGCKRQDRQSQKLLYQSLYGYGMKICLRFTSNQHEAAEVLNDAFFKVFTNIDSYNEQWSFKPWLGKIVYHAAIDYYRSGLRWSTMEKLEKSEPVIQEASVEQKLSYDDLLRLVQRLPPGYRMVFNLYAVDGYSHEEIGEMMGISASTSRSNLYKARLKLQQMLAQPSSLIVLLILKYQSGVSSLRPPRSVIHSKLRHQ